MVQLSHLYMTTGKTIALTIYTFVGKVMSLLFDMLSRYVIAFLPRSRHILISWLQFPSAVILEHKKIKSVTASTFSPSICHEVMELDAMILVFQMLEFQPTFLASSFTLIKGLFSSCLLSAIRVVSSAYLRLLIFLPVVKNPPAVQEMWRPRFDPWVGKVPWRRKCQPTPVFLPGKSHGQRSLVDYSPWGCRRVRHDLATKQQHASSLLQRHRDKISFVHLKQDGNFI